MQHREDPNRDTAGADAAPLADETDSSTSSANPRIQNAAELHSHARVQRQIASGILEPVTNRGGVVDHRHGEVVRGGESEAGGGDLVVA